MTEDDEKLLRNARMLLFIALPAAVVAIPALFLAKAGLFMVCWFAAFLGGLGGVRDAARGSGGNPVLMYLSLVLVFMPVANVPPIAYYLWRAMRGLAGELEAPEPEPAPPPPRKPAPQARPAATSRPAPAAARAATPRARLLTAIASVKAAGLDLDGADGTMLKVNIPLAPDAGEADMPVMRATAGTFAVCYLLDEGGHYAYANAGELKAAGLSLEALHMVGVKNLARQVGGSPGLRMVPQPHGVFGLVLGGQFESSLVLVDALWDETLRKHYKTAPVVTIPARDMLAFCDEASEAGLAGLRAIAERIRAGGDGFMTDKLFVRRDGRWQELRHDKPRDLPPLEFGR
jgi:hypothetical protein